MTCRLAGPFYVRGRAWTDTQILPASRWPHLERRGLPTPIIPWFWILSGPLTHLGGNLRSSYRAGAGPKPEALRLRAPPSLPESSPGPALKAPTPFGPRPQRQAVPLSPRPSLATRPLRTVFALTTPSLGKTSFFVEHAPLGNSVCRLNWASPLECRPALL